MTIALWLIAYLVTGSLFSIAIKYLEQEGTETDLGPHSSFDNLWAYDDNLDAIIHMLLWPLAVAICTFFGLLGTILLWGDVLVMLSKKRKP